MITKTLDIEGPVRIVDYGGEGTLIVLLHGLGGSAEAMEQQDERSLASVVDDSDRALDVECLGDHRWEPYRSQGERASIKTPVCSGSKPLWM